MPPETSEQNTQGEDKTLGRKERRARVRLINKLGFHMRTAGMFVEEAEKFDAEILVRKVGQENYADGRGVLDLVILEAPKGTELEIVCRGEDADEALKALVELVESGFHGVD